MSTPATSNSRTIGRNSFWYAIDASAATVVMLIASVPVARIMGPQVLGYYIYLVFVTNIAQRLANVGIPATACKYMAEYLGRGEPATAHGIFRLTLAHQVTIASIVTVAACAIVHFAGDPGFMLVSYLIVLSMWPSMVNNIPAQANVASENLRANIPGSFSGFITYSGLVVATLVFGWGLVGLATATLVSRTAEAAVRFVGVRRRLSVTPAAAIPLDLRRRMYTYSGQNLVLLGLGLVVWDRSELLFLKHFCSVTEVAFYSLAFSIANQLLMAPRAFSSSIGVTVFAQYGRDWRRLAGLMQNATRYVALLAFPMFLGVVAVAAPLIQVVYGSSYRPVVPVLCLLSIFAIPRAFQAHTENLLQATETQGFMVRWLAVCAVANLSLDWLLIPRYGAIGAAFANGIAQTMAVTGVWVKASLVLPFRVPVRFVNRVAASAVAMLLVAVPLAHALPPLLGLIAASLAGAATFVLTIRVTKCLELEDWVRFDALTARLPAFVGRPFALGLRLAMPAPYERLDLASVLKE